MAIMNAHAMLLRGASLMGMSTSDTDLLTEMNTPFLVGINAAYVDIVRLRDIRVWQAVTLDANRQFLLSTLTDSPDNILDIAQYQHYTAAANWGEAERYDWEFVNGTTVIVPEATESTAIYVQYKPVPDPLVNPYPVAITGHTAGEGATSPSFVYEQDQDAMIYKGLAEYRSSQSDDEAMQKWETKYFQARSNIRRARRQRKIIDKEEY
jgi:hypothetical protein